MTMQQGNIMAETTLAHSQLHNMG